MKLGPLLRLAPIVLATFVLAGCIDEMASIFEIILYEESDDPEVRKVGKVIGKIKEERETQSKLDQFLETGDRRFLTDAKAIRPQDTGVIAYEVVLANLDGDPAASEARKRELAVAEGRRLSGLTEPGDPPITAEQLRRNVLGEILVAQTRLLGGSLTREWDPPPPDAPPKTQRLYADYCDTRRQINTEFNDSLSYIPTPPCPDG